MTNPNPTPEEPTSSEEATSSEQAKGENIQPEAAPAAAAPKDARRFDDDDDSRHAAAEVLPTPAAPKLSTTYEEESIVNYDYLEEEGKADDLSYDEMLALINQYEETLTDIQEGQILEGTVIEVRENEVMMNIGVK